MNYGVIMKHYALSYMLFMSTTLSAQKQYFLPTGDSSMAKEKSITLEQLERYCLAMPAKGLQARNAFDKVTGHTDHHYKIKVEINTIGLLFKLVSQTKYVTVLSESTVIDEPGLRAIPIDVPGNDMEGCIHTLKNGYMKASAREFIHMLGQSTAILKNSTLKGM